jgi:hypothetical protein
MKFYKDDDYFGRYFDKIKVYKLTAICCNSISVNFYKNSKLHNTKNAAHIRFDGYKIFYLNHKLYCDSNNFTKQSWRRFIKLKAFL